MSLGDSRSGLRRVLRASDSVSSIRLTESFVGRLQRELPPREPTAQELSQEPAIRSYIVVCLIAMVVLLVGLFHQGMGSASLIPVLLGIMGVITRWRASPILVILAHSSLYYVQMLSSYGISPMPIFVPPDLGDVLMAGALVVYVAAHFRLQGLIHEIVPQEAQRAARRRSTAQGTPVPELPPRRSIATVAQTEYVGTAFLGAWGVAALLLWILLAWQEPVIGDQGRVHAPVWRGFLLIWVIGVGLLLLSSGLRYWSFRWQTEPEARLHLQDVLWRETRRDQKRINRWLAWARLRRQRRRRPS